MLLRSSCPVCSAYIEIKIDGEIEKSGSLKRLEEVTCECGMNLILKASARLVSEVYTPGIIKTSRLVKERQPVLTSEADASERQQPKAPTQHCEELKPGEVAAKMTYTNRRTLKPTAQAVSIFERLRAKSQLSTTDLEAKTGVSRQKVANWKALIAGMSKKDLEALGKVLGFTIVGSELRAVPPESGVA
ncbi:helix-turn-helix domain-containing protein [Limisalsivibrio acetivorans]|uniref:helix-turn-helix domain-containing protein n=1 Tax=Limisalsivibrio acetivorans TaxID=1304888 RepID=UPI0003B4E0DC|nr:helix-turn-helix transcriptional regulator [Limisalsivibrio acetivorans]